MIQCPKCRAYLLSSYCAVCKKEVFDIYEENGYTTDVNAVAEMFGEDFANAVKGKEKK